MDGEKLKLSEYLLLCSKFEDNPEDESLLGKINEFLSKLSIREYIPLKEKEIILIDVLNMLNKDFDVPGVATFLEIGKLTKGMLAYCVNLENDTMFLTFGYFIVDTFYKYGLYDTIMERCGKDCNRLFKMIDDALNVSNIYRLLETASLFNKESYDEWLQSMKELKDTLDSKTLQEVLDVLGTDSEESKELLNSIKKMAIDSTNREYESESEKFRKAAEAQLNNKGETVVDEIEASVNSDEIADEDVEDAIIDLLNPTDNKNIS
jgi:hypothetical protein